MSLLICLALDGRRKAGGLASVKAPSSSVTVHNENLSPHHTTDFHHDDSMAYSAADRYTRRTVPSPKCPFDSPIMLARTVPVARMDAALSTLPLRGSERIPIFSAIVQFTFCARIGSQCCKRH